MRNRLDNRWLRICRFCGRFADSSAALPHPPFRICLYALDELFGSLHRDMRLVLLVFSYECKLHSLILFVLFNAWDQSKPRGQPMGSYRETSGFLTGTHRFPPLEPPVYVIRMTC